MSMKLMTGAIASAVVSVSVLAGCADNPKSIRVVDQSVLPASAKALFSQDSQITRVEEVTYTKGVREYRVHYTVDGKNKVIHISDADETTPTSVFGHAAGN